MQYEVNGEGGGGQRKLWEERNNYVNEKIVVKRDDVDGGLDGGQLEEGEEEIGIW